MNRHLQHISDKIKQADNLAAAQKKFILKAIKDADKNAGILEAQKRALEIEASLERVRTVAMAMKKPGDMMDVCKNISSELKKLGVEQVRNVQTAIFYKDRGTYMNYQYYVKHKKAIATETSYTGHKIDRAFAAKMLKGKDSFSVSHIKGNKKVKEWIAFQKTINVFIDKYLYKASSLSYYWYSLGPVALGISTYHPLTKDETALFKRFLNVFGLAYRRYLDIEKAEAQAREAQIEAALERVRSHSLAMHHSDELRQVVTSLFDQLVDLGLSFDGALIFLFEKEKRNIQLWIATIQLPTPVKINLPYDKGIKNNAIIKDLWHAIENGKHIFNISYSGNTKNDYFRYVQKYNESKIPEPVKRLEIEKDSWTVCFAAEKNSMIGFDSWSGHRITEEHFKILIRFAKVFEQAYTRFLDLQKAEAQAREAQIETSLERIRAQAMAMHKSEELLAVCEIMYRELKALGFDDIRNAMIHTFNKKNDFFLDYDFAGNAGGKISQIPTKGFPIVEYYLKEIKKGIDTFLEIVFTGKELESWKNIRKATGQLEDPRIESLEALYYYYYSIGPGDIGISTFSPISKEKMQVLERFKNVFQLSYQRYHDIENAEAQAREAKVEAALERVRSKAMSMQKSEDLSNAIAIVFEELDKLNLGPLRCGISIINKEKRTTNIWSTTKSEKGNIVHVSGDESMDIHPLLQGAYNAWLKLEDFSYLLKGNDVYDFYNALSETNFQLPDSPKEIQSEQQYMYVSHFPAGGLYAFSETEFSEEEKNIIRRFGDVFSLTYTRFNDLKIAEAHALKAEQDLIEIEAARKKAEEALAELLATQKQLIQSEKMASLGELTAGIAHEIQNPLNFVNNFSEVNKELIDELNTERSKPKAERNDELENEILNDIKDNSEKISHHGKRADTIVKGMLQHSRTSTGQKELTDINKLADEYLRLSYHGLRAKDKTFNARFETDFDLSLPKVSVVPQEIGRIILNLINNAFYAVNEKRKTNNEQYEPIVTIGTAMKNSKIEIKVKDNGKGIPQNIVDKIFQPFFTTKPTGQGTGLGLSLSYDIIKAHGGEIKVNTKEGEGSEFIIQLRTN